VILFKVICNFALYLRITTYALGETPDLHLTISI